jgi:iron complex outermembrane recepter protein
MNIQNMSFGTTSTHLRRMCPGAATSLLPIASAIIMASTLSSSPALGQGNSLTLEEVIVTARKRIESAQDTPVAVTAITQELQNASIRNLRDIEGYSPNVIIDNSAAGPGAAAISIRGVSYQEVDKSLDPSIGVIIDGIYMGTNVGQVLNNFDIARIEVLRGPQGTLFGKNTIGGVVNVIRNQPSGELGGELRVGTGSWDLRDFKGALHFPIIQDKLAAKVWATDVSNDGWLKNTTLNEGTARTNATNYGFSLLAEPTDNVELQFSYDRLEDHSDTSGSHNRNGPENLQCGTFGPLGDLGIPPFWTSAVGCEALDKGSDKDHVSTNGHQNAFADTDAYTLRMEWDVGPGIITSITGYRDSEEFRRAELDGTAADFLTLTFSQDYDQTSQELNFTSTFSDTVEFVAGLYYWESEYTQHTETLGLFLPLIVEQPAGSTGRLKQNQESESVAAYFQGDWHINEAFTATLGLRYTQEEKTFEGETQSYWLDGVAIVAGETGKANEDWSELTPKLGLGYQHNDDIMLYASYAKGFKSGGFFGRNTTIAGFTTSYDPEFVDTYELGLKSDWLDGRVRFNATAFYSEYTDKQEENIVPLDDGSVGTIVLNASTVDMPGLELELTGAVTENLRLRASYGYLKAEYDDYIADINNDGEITDNSDLKLRRAPENTFGLSATYSRYFGNGEFVGDLTYRWRDEVETISSNDPVGHVDSFGLWSASVDYIYAERYQLSIYGRNLADERHISATTKIGPLVTFGSWNQPRNWGLELRYTF